MESSREERTAGREEDVKEGDRERKGERPGGVQSSLKFSVKY